MILLFRVEVDNNDEEGTIVYTSLIDLIQAALDMCSIDTFFSSSVEEDSVSTPTVCCHDHPVHEYHT